MRHYTAKRPFMMIGKNFNKDFWKQSRSNVINIQPLVSVLTLLACVTLYLPEITRINRIRSGLQNILNVVVYLYRPQSSAGRKLKEVVTFS